MESVRKNDIPDCLKKSELFKILNKHESNMIPVSKKYYYPLLSFIRKFNNRKKKIQDTENDVPKKKKRIPKQEKIYKVVNNKKRKKSHGSIKLKKTKIDMIKDEVVDTVIFKKETIPTIQNKSKKKSNQLTNHHYIVK